MAVDTYLKIDGVPGEATDDQHQDWIEVQGFDHQFSQPASATPSSAGGGTVGRVDMGHFNIVKKLDKATPKLAEYCCSGKSLPSITLQMYRASGDKPVKYMEVKMEGVIIASIDHGRAHTEQDTFPIETVGFNFAKVKWTYTQQQRSDGSAGGEVTGGWDLQAHKSYA